MPSRVQYSEFLTKTEVQALGSPTRGTLGWSNNRNMTVATEISTHAKAKWTGRKTLWKAGMAVHNPVNAAPIRLMRTLQSRCQYFASGSRRNDISHL